jgi:DNA replication protein DnaC
LVIDEIGYLSYSNQHADLLFELMNRRDESKSTIVTTNQAFADWNEVFPNAACVSLIVRLLHHSEVIGIECESYCLKDTRERAADLTAKRKKAKS